MGFFSFPLVTFRVFCHNINYGGMKVKVLIAAGGTGGHITPGIAIANALKEKGHEIIFVGTEKGMEVDLVPKAGYPIKFIHAGWLQKGLSLKNFKTALEVLKGIANVKQIIREEKIDFVIGTGGYVTAPVMIAALKCKVPTLIHESNALPGKTTKWLSGKVDTVALGFMDALKRLPKAKNAVFTGNPTKFHVGVSKEEAKRKLGISKPLVLIFGGSQGAKKINDTMVEYINNVSITDYQMIYATGPKNYDEILSQVNGTCDNIKNGNVRIEKYIYNMDEVMAASDIAVCRSGALTVTELGIAGVPAILIPYPYAAENHQYFNAKTIADNGGGMIIEEKDLNCHALEQAITSVLKDKERYTKMQEAAIRKENVGAIDRILKEINQLCDKK